MGFKLLSPIRPPWGLIQPHENEFRKTTLQKVTKALDFLWFILQSDFLSRPFLSNFKLGGITITGAATTGTWTFTDQLGNAQPETDTNYMLVVTPSSSTGAPAAGSNRVLSYTKTVNGATITLEAAPAGVASQTFDLAILRQS